MSARTLVAWCPDWPLTAAGTSPDRPVVVLEAGRVVVCSAAARAVGVRIGLRQREAQARCPELVVIDADPGRDARVFDPVVAAVVDLVPAVEVVRPGLLSLDARGPTRVFGGESQVARHLVQVVDETVHETVHETVRDPDVEVSEDLPGCRVGIADGRFTAMLAARRTPTDERVVEPGGDAAFLAPLSLAALLQGTILMGGVPGMRRVDADAGAVRDLLGLLRRLGLTTLGDLAALPSLTVADRFGRLGTCLHRLARGDDDRRVTPVSVEDDHTVQVELDPPAPQVEAAAFAVRGPAQALVTSLARRASLCTLVTIEAETEHGERSSRRWRSHTGFTPEALVDRVRWQLDGWLVGSTGDVRPTAGIAIVRLVPTEVTDGGAQTSLLGEEAAATPQVVRALSRIQGMLGPDAVLIGVPGGGRDPVTWVRGVPWGEMPPDPPRGRSNPGREERPWPGKLPAPAPATVLTEWLPAEVVDRSGASVGVSGRGTVTAPLARVRVQTGPWREITGWTGPWPADERWWDRAGRRRARFQLATDDGQTYLLSLEHGRWQVEAVYD